MFRISRSLILGATALAVSGSGVWFSAAQAQEVIDAPYFVTWSSAAVRIEPDTSTDRVTTLEFGDQVFVTGLEGDWYSVELGETGQRGWVWSGVLAPMRMALPGGGGGATGAGQGGAGNGLAFSDDNDFLSAQEIEVSDLGTFRQGSVGQHDESDFYTFTLDGWTDVEIELTDLVSDLDIALYDQDYAFVADSLSSGTDPEFIGVTLGAGIYFVEIYPFDGDSSYTLSAFAYPGEEPPEDQAGDTQDSAFDLGPLGPDEVLYHEDFVGSTDQTDYLRFEVTERMDVQVSVFGLVADVDVTVEDDFGSVIGSSANPGSDDEFVSLLLDPGTYFLVMVPYTGSSGYEVEVSGLITDPAPLDEGGSSFSNAVALGAVPSDGTRLEIEEFVGNGDRADFFSFEVTAAGAISVTLDPLRDDADIRLYADNGNTFLESSEAASNQSELIEEVLEPGIYHVEVTIFGQETEYTLSVGTAN